ncbi:MAG: 2-hydroxyglutaryl-CoA dehydratase, partial [Oscillospiraceae bacterium]|nr:2-hydroxyglutaryl-CoA dehydratase [Oscillospiraceae bacterium]
MKYVGLGTNYDGMFRLGLDIGSTTVKAVVLDRDMNVFYTDYRRHGSYVADTVCDIIMALALRMRGLGLYMEKFLFDTVITGSGGFDLARRVGVRHLQEVIADKVALDVKAPEADVALELGGEDSKIIYITDGPDERMNDVCAGGTGSFIDMMAELLNTSADGLNYYAKRYKTIYPIAARCGVFAKSDLQPLINQGAKKEDLAASIFQAVAKQTVMGLACGKPIRGKVAFLGGPLHFLTELREAYIRILGLKPEQVIVPKDAHMFAATGAALSAEVSDRISVWDIYYVMKVGLDAEKKLERLEPLFKTYEEHHEFLREHEGKSVERAQL